ncbi:MAG: DsbA family protein [Myxococcota bacterium]
MKFLAKSVVTGLAALALTACVTRGEIEELKKNDKEILAKLDKIAAGAGRAGPQQQAPRGPDPEKVYAVQVGDSAAHGPSDAWVTIVEVSDFQCPFCGKVVPTINELQKKYGNDIRVVFKNNPLSFHPRAMPASMSAECAREQGKFWDVYERQFTNQKALEDADLEKYAKESGVDIGRWKACYTSNKYKSRIEEEQRQMVTLGARGTPAFFINGRFLSGAQPVQAFEAIVDEELKKAKESGISKKDYYTQQVEQKGLKTL